MELPHLGAAQLDLRIWQAADEFFSRALLGEDLLQPCQVFGARVAPVRLEGLVIEALVVSLGVLDRDRGDSSRSLPPTRSVATILPGRPTVR